jgi:hypothetical protein
MKALSQSECLHPRLVECEIDSVARVDVSRAYERGVVDGFLTRSERHGTDAVVPDGV